MVDSSVLITGGAIVTTGIAGTVVVGISDTAYRTVACIAVIVVIVIVIVAVTITIKVRASVTVGAVGTNIVWHI